MTTMDRKIVHRVDQLESRVHIIEVHKNAGVQKFAHKLGQVMGMFDTEEMRQWFLAHGLTPEDYDSAEQMMSRLASCFYSHATVWKSEQKKGKKK